MSDIVERLRALAKRDAIAPRMTLYAAADELDQLRAERDNLKQRLELAESALDDWMCAGAKGGWIDSLRVERDALKADAERYRWLRDKSPITWALYVEGLRCWKHDYDAAIDAARKA
jgi:hypothetical protein